MTNDYFPLFFSSIFSIEEYSDHLEPKGIRIIFVINKDVIEPGNLGPAFNAWNNGIQVANFGHIFHPSQKPAANNTFV